MTEASDSLNNLRQLEKCEQHQNDVTVNSSLDKQMAECTVKYIKEMFTKGSLDNEHRIHFKYKDRPCPEFKFHGKRQCR